MNRWVGNMRECNHTLCTLSLSPAWPAANIIHQWWETDAGTRVGQMTHACLEHTELMKAILGPDDTIEPYVAERK